MRTHPAARNTLQPRHGATERCQSSGTFPLNQRFERFANQSRFLSDAGELLGNAEEIIVKGEGCSHRHLL